MTPGRRTGAIFCIFFNGHNVIVHRLPTGQHTDLCVGTGIGKDGLSLPGVLLRHILAVEDGHKLRIPCLGVLRQLRKQGLDAPVGAEELPVLQGQVVPLVDGKAVKVGIPGGIGHLGGGHSLCSLGHGVGNSLGIVPLQVSVHHGGDALGHCGRGHHNDLLFR